MPKSETKNNYLKSAKIISQETFQISLVVYLVAFLIDQVFPQSISSFINLNYILAIAVVTGIINFIFPSSRKELKNKLSKKDYFFIIFLGLIAGLVIYYVIRDMGKVAIPLAICSALIIILLSFLLSSDENDK